MSQALLARRVLVLNRNWVAVHLCTVRRAIGLLCRNMAQVVTEEYDLHDFESWLELSQYAKTDIIRTPTRQVAVPQVIKLNGYSGFPPRQVKLTRRNIYLRDDMRCQYCGKRPPMQELTIDHIVPRSRGGTTTWTNVTLACARCNRLKANKLPDECGLKPLKRPVAPKWISCARNWLPGADKAAPLWQKFIDNAYWNVSLKE